MTGNAASARTPRFTAENIDIHTKSTVLLLELLSIGLVIAFN